MNRASCIHVEKIGKGTKKSPRRTRKRDFATRRLIFLRTHSSSKALPTMAPASPPPARPAVPDAPATMADLDKRDVPAWFLSFSAVMVPFCAFCYGHSRGVTTRVVERMVKSPAGVYGLLALPFVTLGMEKSIYDTVQSWQGIDPNVRPADRGGFPSGGALLPSFSLVPVQKVARRLTQQSQTMASRTEEE